ncbi:MAG TPA: FtsX-like permease family protein [Terriglobia bacterium]|nr:FtsX-like permease family protein [Terriglobia bacterium]
MSRLGRGLPARVPGVSLHFRGEHEMLAGVVPALALSKGDLNEALREGERHASPGHGAWRFRQGLIISEVALTTVALIGAGLLLLSLRRLQRVNPGFDPHHVLAVGLDLYTRKYCASDSVRFCQELTDRLRAQPGVLSVTLTEFLPLSLMRGNAYVTIPGAESKAPRDGFEIQFDSIAPQYLQSLRIPLLEGREFTVRDDNSATPVVIINRTMAERFWPRQNPVGRIIRFLPENTERKVIGVAQDIKYHTLWDAPVSYLYLPMYQSHVLDPAVLVRTTADPMNEVGTVRREVAAMDQLVPIVDVTTLDQQAMDSSAQPRAAAEFVSVFGPLALVLAAAGIYGMLSYWVAGRTHEIGIRLALGAHRASVLKLVVGQGLKLTLIGVGLGVVGSLALTRFLSSVLYGIKPGDPLTFSVVALILGAVAFLASYIPARRATKVEPSVALKCG